MQFAILACALLGVAVGQYTGFPGYQGYQGYQGYRPGYQGYQRFNQYPEYSGYPGYQGYQGFNAFPQVSPVKPDALKLKVLPKTVAPVVPVIAPVTPIIAPVTPVVPIASRVYTDAARGPYAAIRSQAQDSSPDGSYAYKYDTENGINVAETATGAGPNKIVEGEYSYIGTDGQQYTVRYTADENGFHPAGVHIPGSAAYAPEQYRAYNGYQNPLAYVAPVIKPVVVAAENREK